MSEEMKPLVSVRLMVYNNEPYIREAVESILMQKTDFMVEIVVGDDFSTDNTLEIIKSYQNTKNIYFKILKREIGGTYWADRKKLGRLYNFKNIIDNCEGKYIALLDGDDYWTDPLKLQKQVDFLKNNREYNGCFHNSYSLNNDDKKSLTKWRSYNRVEYVAEDTITTLSLFHTSSYLFRNDIEIPQWFYKIFSGDMALLAIISSYGKLYYFNEVMSVYRIHCKNITSNMDKIQYHKNRIILMKQINEFFDKKYSKKTKEVVSFHKRELSVIKISRLKKTLKKIFK
ncbi:MAG: glycosyltransferase [Algicola sp.]|nr:glycosyltransferase [Algicola sp.]